MKVMDFNDIPSTKPYLLRAIHEWCSDNGYTPYMAVSVDHTVEVPAAFVNDGQIVLNVSYGATQGLQMANDMVSFKGRFSGKVQDIFVPVNRVLAIYARENGQGMAFPATDKQVAALDVAKQPQPASATSQAKAPALVSVVTSSHRENASDASSETDPTPRPPTGGGAGLRRVK
jgi:stringent starvation protein B